MAKGTLLCGMQHGTWLYPLCANDHSTLRLAICAGGSLIAASYMLSPETPHLFTPTFLFLPTFPPLHPRPFHLDAVITANKRQHTAFQLHLSYLALLILSVLYLLRLLILLNRVPQSRVVSVRHRINPPYFRLPALQGALTTRKRPESDCTSC